MKKGLLAHQSGMVMTVTVIIQALMISLQNGLIELQKYGEHTCVYSP